MRPLLVLRPEPGASATAERARGLGLRPVVAPLFNVEALTWDPPDASAFDAMLFTSANAPRHAGPEIARYLRLPAYAVGVATAAAVRDAGFDNVTTGTRDAEQLVNALNPNMRVLHLCGVHRVPSRRLHQVPVYVSQASPQLSAAARDAIRAGPVAMLHSPRAATLFANLIEPASRSAVALVAISDAAVDIVGPGWRIVAAASEPTDAAMLAIARILCENDTP